METKSMTAAAAPPEEICADYLPPIRRRWQAQQEAWEQRRREAWDAAREIAAILRLRFGATWIHAPTVGEPTPFRQALLRTFVVQW